MRLKRVGCDAGIVAPDLVQQDVAGDHAFGGAVEEFEDIRLFFGQTYFPVFFIDQHLHCRFERVRPKLEDRVFGLLMLAQLRTDAGQKDREFERFGDVIVGTCIEAEDGVGVGIMAGQHQNRAFDVLFAHPAAQFAAIGVGQADIEDDQIIDRLFGFDHRGRAAVGLEHVEIFCHYQLFAERFAQVVIIVDEENFL